MKINLEVGCHECRMNSAVVMCRGAAGGYLGSSTWLSHPFWCLCFSPCPCQRWPQIPDIPSPLHFQACHSQGSHFSPPSWRKAQILRCWSLPEESLQRAAQTLSLPAWPEQGSKAFCQSSIILFVVLYTPPSSCKV